MPKFKCHISSNFQTMWTRISYWSIRNKNDTFFKIFTHCALTLGSEAYSAKIQHFFSHFSNLLWTTTSCQMIFITIQFCLQAIIHATVFENHQKCLSTQFSSQNVICKVISKVDFERENSNIFTLKTENKRMRLFECFSNNVVVVDILLVCQPLVVGILLLCSRYYAS